MPKGEATGKTWIKTSTALLLGTEVDGKLDRTTLDRGGQGFAYLALVAYSRERLTDGFVPTESAISTIRRACGSDPELTPERRLADMRAIGLVKRDRHGYRIPDYTEWQQPKEAVMAVKERQSAKARKRWEKHAGGTASGIPAALPGASRAELELETPLTPIDQEPKSTKRGTRASGTSPRQQAAAAQSANGTHRAVAALVTFISRELAETDTPGERERIAEHLRAEQRAKHRDPDLVDTAMATYAQQHPDPQI